MADINETIFHAYDIRATYPDQINDEVAKKIAHAYAKFLILKGKTIAVGRDVRLSGPSLQEAVIEGLTEMGANVLKIGVVPTEVLYFTIGSLNLAGGIQISASHNPAQYNGLKLMREGVQAISSDTGLKEIKTLATSQGPMPAVHKGNVKNQNIVSKYVEFIASLVDLKHLPRLKIIANNNFGVSGPIAKKVLAGIGSHESVGHFEKMRTEGKLRYSDLKEAVIEDLTAFLRPIQKAYYSIREEEDSLRKILVEGRSKAQIVAAATLKEAKEALGLIQ